MKKITLVLFFLLSGKLIVFAQTTPPVAGPDGVAGIMTDPMNYLIVFVMAILFSTILVMAKIIKSLIYKLAGAPKVYQKPISVKVKENKPSFWTQLNTKMNDAVPVEKEADILMDHDYDGIKELDNNLPPWWKYGFYLTIVFAFIYMAHYHVAGSGNVQLDEYNEQLAEAEVKKAERLKTVASNVDETTVTYLVEEKAIASGKKIYTEKCLVCHGKAGEGLVGPNLTDEYWIHGGSIQDIFKIIKYGFPSKGMLAWQGQLTPLQIQEISSFVKSIHGTNPPNPKEPQGDIYTETGSGTAVEGDTTIIASMKDSSITSKN